MHGIASKRVGFTDEELLSMVQQLRSTSFYGTLELKFQAGHVGEIHESRTWKPGELGRRRTA
jgi:hypothetical protein